MQKRKVNPLKPAGDFSALVRLSADKKMIADYFRLEKELNTDQGEENYSAYCSVIKKINNRWQDSGFKTMFEEAKANA